MTSRGYSATGTSAPETYGGWGPAPEGPQGPPPRRGQKRRITFAAVAAACGLLACGAITAAILLTASGGPHRNSSPPSSAGTVPVQQSVAELASIVAASASDRSRVISAIDRVQNCSLQPVAGEAAIQSVVADRRRSVSRLQSIATAKAATTSPLADDLMTTLNAAISDDLSYTSWMEDIASGHATCGGDPANDPNFAAAQAQSGRTNADKQQFVSLWNPLAARYGQPTYRADDF